MQKCGFSETECKIILAQIERRAKYRKEFLKLRTDPCMHAKEAGHVYHPEPTIYPLLDMSLVETYTRQSCAVQSPAALGFYLTIILLQFDPALQRWQSMKSCQYEYFKATPKMAVFGFTTIVVPMLVYGYAVWKQRTTFLEDCAEGRIRYRDRINKLA